MLPVVEIHDALRVDPLNRQIADLTGSGARTVLIETPAIEGPTLPADPVQPFRIAGDEYLVINGSDIIGEADVAAASMRIDLTVGGEQVEGPRLAVVGAGTTPSPTPDESTPPPTDDAAAPDVAADADDDSGGVPGWLVVLGVVTVLAVAAALVLATRRRGAGA